MMAEKVEHELDLSKTAVCQVGAVWPNFRNVWDQTGNISSRSFAQQKLCFKATLPVMSCHFLSLPVRQRSRHHLLHLRISPWPFPFSRCVTGHQRSAGCTTNLSFFSCFIYYVWIQSAEIQYFNWGFKVSPCSVINFRWHPELRYRLSRPNYICINNVHH